MNNISFAQKRNNIWCFGDSSGIDFNLPGGPVPISSVLNTRGSCVSIADTSGQLLFYSAYDETVGIFGTDPVKVFSKNNAIMINGDSIKGGGWYKELVIVPASTTDSLYYLFNIGVTFDFGLYYSLIDMKQNNGMGAVVQKNVQLQTFKCTDGINAVKHGNGRDWWLIFRRWDTDNDEYYMYLISQNGISNVSIQHIGSSTMNGFTNMNFSSDGSKMVVINLAGLMEIYDFDRCTGIISNPLTLHPEPTTAPYGRYVGCEFSPNGRFLYVSTYIDTASRLFQYDLNSLDPVGTRDTIEYVTNGLIGNGFLKRGPDNKIYFGHAWECQAFPSCYPYPDSVYNSVNMNLSVINYPDSLGSACNYTPYSFYLGGTRTHYGLPNNPDYDLPALAGSPCDTLVGVDETPEVSQAAINVFYHSVWEKAFINASNLKGKAGKLMVYDMQGKVVHSEPLRIQNGYYTRDLSMIGRADGVYLVVVETEQERLVKKVLID
ncbi:MAG: T9SS type A sorting domain-containing protein [Bacteroidia bacterium]|nr:T9SS type A sorting domain-containing protein [Bacteroidia bacterium]